jgi:putative tryptophan/tyrosine transport system substrate-binding protein
VKRRDFTALLAGALVAGPLSVGAQQSGKVYRIGILETQSAPLNAANMTAFRDALRAEGYVDGKNLVIEYRSAEGQDERFPDLVRQLLKLNCDVIVTRGTPAALAARDATSTTPIVMTAIGDPLLVAASLRRPGGNITGMSAYGTELEAKRVEILHEMVAQAVRIAGLYNMGNPVAPPQWDELKKASEVLGLQAALLDVRSPKDITRAFDTAIDQHIEAIAVGLDALTQANRKMIVDLAAKNRLPAIYPSREYVDAGGLLAYAASFTDLYRQAATYVRKIFSGENPAELPIQQPTKFELVINLKTAQALGLTVPQSLLARADEVIE